MTQPVQIQLTVEESLEFQRHAAYWDGMADGFRQASEKAKRMKLDELIQARKQVPPPANSTEPPTDGV